MTPGLPPPRTIAAGDRGRRGLAYTLLTPANRYVSRLPTLPGAELFKLVTPRLAPARFAQYLVEAGERALSCPVASGFEHFLLAIGGDCHVSLDGGRRSLGYRGFAYLPLSSSFSIELGPAATVMWIKRRYEPWPGLEAPPAVFGSLPAVPADPTPVLGLVRRELLDPADPAFDFNISHMEFAPDAALAQIEIHDEEHGLYMTSGGGVYHLDGDEHTVAADDFIYMAPYCPQGFSAGPDGGSYLLYKDVYRDGF
jgi:(S)-ureidoglycine aminohydrolase